MIISVNDDGSITKTKLQGVLRGNQKRPTSKKHTRSRPKPNPKFSQFDEEFQQLNSFERKVEPKRTVKSNEIKIPEAFKHTAPIQHSSIQNEVSALQVPEIFKSNNSPQSNHLRIRHRQKPIKSLTADQMKWPPEPAKKESSPEDPTRFYF